MEVRWSHILLWCTVGIVIRGQHEAPRNVEQEASERAIHIWKVELLCTTLVLWIDG